MTNQQMRFLEFVSYRIALDGVSPSFQEIADELGYKSKANIHRIAHSLREDGLVTFFPGKHRNILPTFLARGILAEVKRGGAGA